MKRNMKMVLKFQYLNKNDHENSDFKKFQYTFREKRLNRQKFLLLDSDLFILFYEFFIIYYPFW